ncbi:RNA-binding KH domain-containing protein [Artemisia annua]|uniref:RNA-binding KH domain-containing protein n=1 Tax=Artemisia annua TaxID=35608 RepID=A0A2U1MGB9_ARTAN|nr:RNA-binding KH domain-containing protein [Artemisia annua]
MEPGHRVMEIKQPRVLRIHQTIMQSSNQLVKGINQNPGLKGFHENINSIMDISLTVELFIGLKAILVIYFRSMKKTPWNLFYNTDLRRYTVDESILLAFLFIRNTGNPVSCLSTRNNLIICWQERFTCSGSILQAFRTTAHNLLLLMLEMMEYAGKVEYIINRAMNQHGFLTQLQEKKVIHNCSSLGCSTHVIFTLYTFCGEVVISLLTFFSQTNLITGGYGRGRSYHGLFGFACPRPVTNHRMGVNEEVVFRLLCQADKVGSLIGKCGSYKIALRTQTGASIKINYSTPESDERLCLGSLREKGVFVGGRTAPPNDKVSGCSLTDPPIFNHKQCEVEIAILTNFQVQGLAAIMLNLCNMLDLPNENCNQGPKVTQVTLPCDSHRTIDFSNCPFRSVYLITICKKTVLSHYLCIGEL